MAVEFISVSTQVQESNDSPAASIDVNFNANQEGDFLLAVFATSTTATNPAVEINAQAGWTKFSGDNTYSAFTAGRTTMFYRFAPAGGITSETFTAAADTGYLSNGFVFRGVDETNPIDVGPLFTNGTGVTSTSVIPPAYTTVTDGALGILSVNRDGTPINVNPPAGYTELIDQGVNNVGDGNIINLSTLEHATAGTQTPGSFTWITSQESCAMSFALRPDTGGGGPIVSTYSDAITDLNANHLWTFDGDFLDTVGSLNGTNTGMVLTGAACCEDAANSASSDGTGDRVAFATSTDVDGALDRKAVTGWLRTNSIQLPPKSIWREGTTNNQFNIVMWAGNNLMLDIVNGATVVQAFSDQVLEPNRNYHIFARVEGTGFGNKVELYIDGVLQSITEPSNGELGAATLAARTAAELADPSGTTEVGNATVLLNAPTNGFYNYWATFSGADAQLTDTEIRVELFEKGALPGVTITSDTAANMQIALDAIASTARPDEPLNIRVEEVTGGGDFTLSADNITHNVNASIHVQYMGADTLTWVNNNGSNASIGSTPEGGTLTFVTPATLNISPLIANSEVRIYEAGTQNELAGIENSGTSFSPTINAASVDVVIHSLDYVYERIDGIDMSQGDVSLSTDQAFDRNYENP